MVTWRLRIWGAKVLTRLKEEIKGRNHFSVITEATSSDRELGGGGVGPGGGDKWPCKGAWLVWDVGVV